MQGEFNMFRKMLMLAALALPGVAHANWQEASSTHFVVYANDTPDNLRRFTERLERFDAAMRVFRQLKSRPMVKANRVTVYVLDDLDDLQRLYGKGGSSIAGFYNGRAWGSVAFSPRKTSDALSSRAILLHEYSHHFMLANWTDTAFPMWYVEGFAELHATAQFRDDGSVLFGGIPEYRRYGVGFANQLPLDRLLRPIQKDLNDEQRAALYGRGWLLSHYLTFTNDSNRKQQFAAYLSDINGGKPVETALAEFKGLTDITLDAYGQRPRLASALIKADQYKVDPVTVRELTAGEAAVMPARMASERGVDKDLAPKIATLARKLAVDYPNDPGAQVELAEAEFDAENYSAAEAAADRALAIDPKFVRAILYKGMAQGAAAKKAKENDPAKWQAIRRNFLAANKLDNENPVPLMLYYDSFGDAGQAATANAQEGLLYAYALAPYDLGLRVKAGHVFLQRGNAAQARVALAAVAFNPHVGSDNPIAKAIEALDSGGTEAALKVLKDAEEKEKKKKEADGGKAG
jgi:tetratricopeptide (TPR) repeat protein